MSKRILELMGLNREQADALDVDRDTVVSAGAGSGKTRALVARYLAILEQSRACVDGIVALTFTENAAAEMKGRIRGEIGRYIERHGEVGLLTRETVRRLTAAPIGTIHSFASRILMESPLEAGLDPGFRIIEGAGREAFVDAALDGFFRDVLEGGGKAGEALLGVLEEEGFDFKRVKEVIAEVLRQSATLHVELEAARPAPTPSVPLDETFGGLRAAVERMSLVEKPGASGARIRSIAAAAGKLPAGKGPSAGLLSSIWRDADAICKQKSVKDDVLVLARDVRDISAAPLDALLAGFTETYLGAARAARDYIEARKAEAGVLEYEDLLTKALDLLRRRTDVLEYYRAKIRYIIVDEFQDTDGVQKEMIDLLSEGGSSNLFVVGDRKQAIYRFRGADPGIFDRVREGARSSVSFTANYRSTEGMIGFFNAFFREALPGSHEDMTPGLGDSTGGTSAQKGPGVELILNQARTLEQARLMEADVVAERVSGLRAEGRDYGDIAIILRYRAQMGLFESALRARGIPYYSPGGRSFFEQAHVRDLMVLLRYMLNPSDVIAEASVLRSPIFGASDAELLTHYARGEGEERVSRFLTLLRGLRGEVMALGAVDAVELVMERTGYLHSVLARPGARAAYENISRFVAMISRLDADGLPLFEILAHLGGPGGEDYEPASRAELEGEGSVHILSSHKAKGLEFPVVIIADTNHAPGVHTHPVLSRRGEGFVVKPTGVSSPLGSGMGEVEKEEGRSEEKRILYVSMTRAREGLILSVSAGTSKSGPKSGPRINPGSLAETVHGVLGLEGDFDAIETVPFAGASIPVWRGAGGGDIAEVPGGDTGGTAHTLSGFEPGHFEGRFAPLFNSVLDAPSIGPLDVSGEPAMTRAGEIMHGFLELWDFDPGSVDRYVRHVLRKHMASAEGMEEPLMRLAESFLRSELYERIRRAKRYGREVPYVYHSRGWLERGRMDLVLDTGERMEVYDYKMSSSRGGLDRYAPQLERYRRALESLGGRGRVASHIVLIPAVEIVGI